MKKDISLTVFLCLFVMSFGFVSALSPGQIGEQVKDFYIDLFEPILAALFGGWDLGGLFLFEKFLIFILLVAVIFVIIKRVEMFKDNGFVLWSISIIIPLIGVRFFNIEQINTIIYSYKWVAIGLTSVLPFLIFFFFIHTAGKNSGFLRKTLWIIFIGIYAGLWSSSQPSDANVYLWTLVAAAACLIFDNTVAKRLIWNEVMKGDKHFKNNQLIAINTKIHDLEEALRTGAAVDKKTTLDEIKELRKHAKWLMRQ